LGKIIKKIKKRFGKGYTFLVVPNSGEAVKSLAIPFSLLLILLAVILINIYIFVGYTAQIRDIYNYRRKIGEKNQYIAKLEQEQKEVKPSLKKSYQIAKELTRLKNEHAKMAGELKVIKQKAVGRSGSQVSRGVMVRVQPYRLPTDLKENVPATSLQRLNENLAYLEKYVEIETEAQSSLMRELLAYERLLDHTPTIWPAKSRYITSRFGFRIHPKTRKGTMHEGVDIKASYGTKVYAAADGVVSSAGYRSGYGYTVIIDHGYGYQSLYGHNSKLIVGAGTKVKKGQLISYSGNSGTSTGPHLHYEVRVNGKPVNPALFLRY